MIAARSIVGSFAVPLMLSILLNPARSHAQDCRSNVMIVLDRSCSMWNNSIAGKRRWDIVKDSLTKLVNSYSGKLQFGLVMYPDKSVMRPAAAPYACPQTASYIAPMLGTEQAIIAAITNSPPGDGMGSGNNCVTNMDAGVKQAIDEPSLYTLDRRSFLVLITDGGANSICNGDRAQMEPRVAQYITEAYNKKVPTYVIGFADDMNSQPNKDGLNIYADAGGVENPAGTPKYYPANTEVELDTVLAKLGANTYGDTSTCRGLPCPDNRCLTATATCTDGYCVEPNGPDPENPGGGSVATGCSCQLGGQGAASTGGLAMLLFAGVFLRRRRATAARCSR